MSQALVSIIIPLYNKADFMAETIDSVLAQSYQNFEIILVNDGSPDHSEKIALDFVKKDQRISYLAQTNQGVSVARNNGIKQAKGQYILPLDADDTIAKDYLKLAVNHLENHPDVGLVYCKAYYQYKNKFRQHPEWFLGHYTYHGLLGFNTIFNACMFPKVFFDKMGGYDETMLHGIEDWEFLINFIQTNQCQVHQLDYAGFFYRVDNQNSRGQSFNKAAQKQATFDYIYQKHQAEYQKYYGGMHINVIMDMCYHQYKTDKMAFMLRTLFKQPLRLNF